MTSVSVRHLETTDMSSETLWRFVSDPRATAFVTWNTYSDKCDFAAFVKRAHGKRAFPEEFLAILAGADVIGTAHVILRDTGHVQIGIGIASTYWGKGIGAVALTAVTNHVRNHWPSEYTILLADIHRENERAIRLFQRAGYVQREFGVERDRDRYVFDLATSRPRDKAAALLTLLATVQEVLMVCDLGSPTGNALSDDDFLVVTVDERSYNDVIGNLEAYLGQLGDLVHLSRPTPSHWFAVFSDFQILDIHVISFPLLNAVQKRRIVRQQGGFERISDDARGRVMVSLLHDSVLQLTRITGKLLKGQLFAIPPFFGALRERNLIPLMALAGLIEASSAVHVDLGKATPAIQDAFMDLFPKPETSACVRGLRAGLTIVEEIEPTFSNIAPQIKPQLLKIRSALGND